eukprot:TRINITY_DN74991_c0_g1_i1.p1 TRINITY_DN74991_c0_g1~~TRINITY_DN74991_c0_g1_i1.p1  ORF type:complete len:647 (-),score=78.72 TRINITY_DN74991_c0_g1_i1:114-2027(-)
MLAWWTSHQAPLPSSEPECWGEVALIVYALHGASGLNALTESAGLGGAYHVGVAVYGLEWSFGYADEGTGVSPCHVGTSGLGTFKESVPLGRTPWTPEEVLHIIANLRNAWLGVDYELLTRNCAHFGVELVRQLHVQDAPKWVSSLAKVGERITSALGVTGAREMAKAATPAERCPPPLMALNEEDLDDLVSQNNWNAAVEKQWRGAQAYVLELKQRMKSDDGFEDITVEMIYDAHAVSTTRGRHDAKATEAMAQIMASDREFRALCFRAASIGIKTKPRVLQMLGLTACRGQCLLSLRLRRYINSGDGPLSEWPSSREFSRRFLSTISSSMTQQRQSWKRQEESTTRTEDTDEAWPESMCQLAATLRVVTVPGQPTLAVRDDSHRMTGLHSGERRAASARRAPAVAITRMTEEAAVSLVKRHDEKLAETSRRPRSRLHNSGQQVRTTSCPTAVAPFQETPAPPSAGVDAGNIGSATRTGAAMNLETIPGRMALHKRLADVDSPRVQHSQPATDADTVTRAVTPRTRPRTPRNRDVSNHADYLVVHASPPSLQSRRIAHAEQSKHWFDVESSAGRGGRSGYGELSGVTASSDADWLPSATTNRVEICHAPRDADHLGSLGDTLNRLHRLQQLAAVGR